MAYLQERVTHYLTSDPHLFVAEERMLQYGPDKDKDVWFIDALAVDPWKRTFFLGEATYNARPAPLMRKIIRFYEIKDEVLTRLSLGEPPLDGWDVRPWLFIKKDALPFVLSKLPKGCYPKITYLEATAFPWEYEKLRSEGKEPEKSGLDQLFQ